MFGKIRTCPEGHGICEENSFETLPAPKKCPQCNQAFGKKPGRGVMVEQIIAAGQWACKHDCGLKCRGSEMATHVSACPARPLNCPSCLDLVPPARVVKHFQDKPHDLTDVPRCSQDAPTQVCACWEWPFDKGHRQSTMPQDLFIVCVTPCQHGLVKALKSAVASHYFATK
jgi:hypothetical protein